VIGFELCLVDSNSLGLSPVDSESLWLLIMPKSKDRFMDRPPMKNSATMVLYGYGLA
jgi:hypothetical protein